MYCINALYDAIQDDKYPLEKKKKKKVMLWLVLYIAMSYTSAGTIHSYGLHISWYIAMAYTSAGT